MPGDELRQLVIGPHLTELDWTPASLSAGQPPHDRQT